MSLTFANLITIAMIGGIMALGGAALLFHLNGLSIVNRDETLEMIDRLEQTYDAAEDTRVEMLRTADCCVENINDAVTRANTAHKQLEEILGDINNA